MPVTSCQYLDLVRSVPFLLVCLVVSFITQLIPPDPFLDPLRFLRAISAFQDSRLFTSSSPVNQLFLTEDVLNAIDTAYSKSRTTEPYKVHRVLLNKLDDLTTDLRTSVSSNINSTDIDQFVLFAETKAVKDGVPSLKHLWSGRAEMLAIKRKDRPWSDGESDNARDRDGSRDKSERTEELPVSDENDMPKAWRGKRVQRKIESWAG
jgi:hypothetical protein